MSRPSSRGPSPTNCNNMSPHVSARSISGYGHGSSIPSGRVAGFKHSGVGLHARYASQSGGDGEHSRRGSFDFGSDPKEDESEESSQQRDASGAPLKVLASPISSVSGGETPSDAVKNGGRLLIVANRLPLSMSIKRKPVDESSSEKEKEQPSQITFSTSSGGLVSALSGCDMESRWIGWPGAEVKRQADRDLVTQKLEGLKCVPVFLTQKVCDPFYNGFCNNLLWPLMHYIPLPVESIGDADSQFEAYKSANESFAEAVLAAYEDGDLVWVHDYHLLLLPGMLRQKKPNIKIGFFFHTPFPAFEIWRMLPGRRELLEGVLASNLIGFHTRDYCRHFQKSCERIVNATAGVDSLTYKDFTAQLGTFPIGIDPNKFLQALEKPALETIIAEYKKEFKGRKVLLGIDRLDYIKGIQHKLYAFERLLEKHPELRSQVVLVQIAVPSRTDVVEYQKLRSSTHELVGRINGLYGGVGHAPVHYLDQSIAFDRMCALYRVADAMVITSVRDGMNLVAYEYIACQQKYEGVLVLSEFAGAAQTLSDGPILVNPWSITELSEAMHAALLMPTAERQRRQQVMFDYVTTHTAQRWARNYIKGLLQVTGTPLAWLKELDPADATTAAAAAAASTPQSKSSVSSPSSSTYVGDRQYFDQPVNVRLGVTPSPSSHKSLFVREGSMFSLGQ